MTAARPTILLILVALANLCELLAPYTAIAMPSAPEEPSIFYSIDGGSLKRVAVAIKTPELLYARDSRGRTTLSRAVAARKPAIVALLLTRKIDLDGRDLTGETALHWAARTGDVNVVNSLLAAGANPRLYNRRCEAPADLAAGFGAEALYGTLSAAAKKAPPPTDGTADECMFTRATASASAAGVAFYRRRFSITHAEDYLYAGEALEFLTTHEIVASHFGDALPPLIAQLLDHDLPQDADPDDIEPAADAVRTAARTVLKHLKITSSGRAGLDRALLTIIGRGLSRPGFSAALATLASGANGKARAVKALDDLRAKHGLEPAEYRRFKARYVK